MWQRVKKNLVEFWSDMDQLDRDNGTPDDRMMVIREGESFARYQSRKDMKITDFDTEDFGVGLIKETIHPLSGTNTQIEIPTNMALTEIVWNVDEMINPSIASIGILDEDDDQIYLDDVTEAGIYALDCFETKTDYTIVGEGVSVTITLTFSEYD